MARMTSLLEQLLQAQLEEGTSGQQPTLPQPLATPVIMNPQNLETNLVVRPQGMTSILLAHPITPT